ncbi:MAG: VWA domain-containing protein [Bacteroidetes bacterium]|nr:MAG: VWA domain-containing protein [Bacteroidota bacterium]
MIPWGRFLLIGMGWLLSSLSPHHVMGHTPSRINRALNRYVDFANECTHAFWTLHGQLETLNQVANRYPQNPALAPGFQMEDQIEGQTLLNTLQGICAIPAGSRRPLVNLQRLYEDTRIEEAYIPRPIRSNLNTHRDEIWYITIELLARGDSLIAYIEREDYRYDTGLQTLYQHLLYAERLFDRFRHHTTRLYQLSHEAGSPAPDGLKDLALLVRACRQTIWAVRGRERGSIQIAYQDLTETLRQVQGRRSTRLPEMAVIGFPVEQAATAYEDMLEYAEEMTRAVAQYLRGEIREPRYDSYSPEYFLYNQRLLTLFNHYRYGMTGYYNRLQRFSPQALLSEGEEVPWLEIVLPTQTPTPSLPDTNAPRPEPRGSLEASPTNHLVFLLDVSASMKKPDKLPVLKEAMLDLLEQLRPEDRVSIVVYSGEAQVVLEAASALYRDQIVDAINRLASSGETRLDLGLKKAYRLAETYYLPGGNNRILLASDGAFETRRRIRRLISHKAESGIKLSVLLLSRTEIPRTASQLRDLARTGRGNYYHMIPENARRTLLTEAQAVFD